MAGTTESWVATTTSDWSIGSNWSSGTTPGSTTDAVLATAGTITVSQPSAANSLTIDNSAAVVEVNFGTLAINSAIAIEAGTLDLDGTLAGGTVIATGGTFMVSGFSAALDGVTYDGTLTIGGNQAVAIDGLTLLGASGTGAGELAVTSGTATFDATQTLAAGTIALGGDTSLSVTSGSTLTLGTAVMLQTTGSHGTIEGNVVNNGTIAASVGGDTLTVAGGLLNQGLIAISSNGDLAVSATATLDNLGTITVGTGGTLTLLGGFANSGSINAAGGTIVVGGAATQAELLAFAASGASLVLAGTLDNTGGTLQVGPGSALGTLAVSGAIRNGIIADAGGGIVLSGGTLDGVTYQGTLDVNGFQPSYVIDGLTLTGAGGLGQGALVVTGALEFANTETLGAGLIDLGGATGTIASGVAALGAVANAVATLGPSVDLEQTGANVGLGMENSFYPGGPFANQGTIINQGTIDAGFTAGTMTLAGGSELINQGLLDVRNGESFVALGTLVNSGTLLIGAGATLDVTDSALWSNTGTIKAAGGTVVLSGSVTSQELQSFAGSGANLVLTGTLDNTGGTLAIGAGSTIGTFTLGGGDLTLSGGEIRAGGDIRGGVIADGGGGLIAAPGTFAMGGTLDGVTYQGSPSLGHPGDSLTIQDGLNLLGTISVTGANANLIAATSQTLTGSVAIGGTAPAPSEPDLVLTNGATLTLAPSSIVTQIGPYAGLNGVYAGVINNQGTIQAGVAGGVFTMGPLANAGTITVGNADVANIAFLTNAGQVSVGTGGVLTLGGYSAGPGGHLNETNATLNLNGSSTLPALASISRSGGIVAIGSTGSLDLGGGTLALGGGTALGQLRDNGVIANGTIADAGGGAVFYGSGNAKGVLRNVTYEGLVNLVPALSSLIVQGLTATGVNGAGAGTVNVLGAGSQLDFQGSQTFDNATINFGSGTESETLGVSDPAMTGAVLTLGPHASLQHRGAMGQIDIDRGLGDSLVNQGLIAANSTNGHLILLGGTFTNAGNVVVANGDTFSLEADQVSNLYANVLNGGYWEVDPSSTLSLGMDNSILNLNAVLNLNGPGSQVQYYDTTKFQTTTIEQTLNSIGSHGVLVLQNGRVFDDPGLMFNSGQIVLANASLSAQPLVVASGGVIFGTGTITASNIYDSGHVFPNNGSLVINGALLAGSPAGDALIPANSALVLNGVSSITAKFLANTGTLALDQPLATYGNITGFTGADAIDLPTVGPAGIGFSYYPGSGSGVLVLRTGSVNDAVLHLSGSYVTGNFTVQPDGHGGTLILDPPIAASMAANWVVTARDLAAAPGPTTPSRVGASGTIIAAGPRLVPEIAASMSIGNHLGSIGA